MAQTCQNCKKEFQIEQEDLQFYERINVPPPTWCPECRLMRRFMWRNERMFYHNICSKTNKKIISIFSFDSGIKVYDRNVWWSDEWDPMDYGKDYDFNKPFFEQWKNLFYKIPHPSVFNTQTVNSDFSSYTGNMKNAYLVSASWGGENIYYCSREHFCKDTMDVFATFNSELCYECIETIKSSRLLFSQNCEGCVDSAFLYNCRGCTNCFGCVGLRNKSYYFFNKPYSKEEYYKKLKDINIGSYLKLQEIKQQFEKLKMNYPYKYGNILNSKNVTGNNILNTSNCKFCFDVNNQIKDSKFIINAVDNLFNSYDGYGVGTNCELLYESINTGFSGSRECFCATVYGGHNTYYCFNCHSSSNLFGCIGLRNNQYCILNKQYTKEEYESLVPKIIEHMNTMPYIDKKGRIYKYGEFFPSELSPFCYNETIAQEYFPKTKEQALSEGYNWKEPEEKNIIPDIKTEDLKDNIKDIDESIIGKIIQCRHSKIKEDNTLEPTCNEMCTRGFKIIKQELDFYKRMSLPIPRLCPNCRHFQRLKQRNPLKLWHRKCECQGTYGKNPNNPNTYQNQTIHFHQNNPCSNEFETSYPPESPAIVYCEECYNKEVV